MTIKKNKTAAFLALIVFICAIPFCAAAEVAPPKTIGAPEHFAAGHYYGDQIYFTISTPDDLRDYIERRAEDDPDKQIFSAHIQIDCKIDNGNWHYTKDWDSPAIKHKNIIYDSMKSKTNYLNTYERISISSMFPDDTDLKAVSENGWDYFKSHSITFRARFVESFDKGKTNVISNWSNEYTLSGTLRVDPNKMINHAPTLLSADLKTDVAGAPYLDVISDRIPGDIMDLHSISSGNIRTEIWMRRLEDKEFKLINQDGGNLELFKIKAKDYFNGAEQSYDAQSYEIKIRYALDLRKIKQSAYAGSTSGVYIYSPFSNIISHNMPAWSKTSPWATPEVEKAQKNGLYPDKLKGADLTRPITRAEFAAVALKLYESLSGKTATGAPTSTFTDTKDLDVLKAFALDIVAGVGNNRFAPDELISREQAATMLTRVFKKVYWDGWTLAGDNTYTKHSLDNKGVPTFADDAKISAYAKPSVYFMAKYSIIVGNNNIFAPRNTTSAETAAGYANATREQALAISNRTFEKVDKIQDGGPVEPPAQPSPTPTPTPPPKDSPTPTPTPPETGETKPSDGSLAGVWMGLENRWATTGYYTDSIDYMTIFDDGTVYHNMLIEGLGGFDKNKSRYEIEDLWGTYTFDGSKGVMKINDYVPDDLVMDEKGNLQKGSSPYYRCHSVDGLKLKGDWSLYADPIDQKEYASDVISFTLDGKFVDKGVFATGGFYLPEQFENYYVPKEKVAPGKGTYEIKDFTLTLRYDDGRVRKASFNLLFSAKPEQSPGIIYIYSRNLFIIE